MSFKSQGGSLGEIDPVLDLDFISTGKIFLPGHLNYNATEYNIFSLRIVKDNIKHELLTLHRIGIKY